MKIVQLNSVSGSGSTGKICVAISELLTEKGVENYILYALGKASYPLSRRYMSGAEVKIQALKSKIKGTYGFQAKSATKRLIKELEKISPDAVHLHNLHSHNIHIGILFKYLKDKNIKIFWTFHDCWSFTAYCPHFTMVSCDKWKTGCEKCPQYKRASYVFDRSKWLYKNKKELFKGLDLTIITPSHWMAELVKDSIFKEYPVKVIHNGVDLDVFVPRESDFRKKYHISEDKKILLGVAFDWGVRKGLDVFVKLAEVLSEKYQIVLVGTNEKIDKNLPQNIISIHRTQNQQELAEIYTSADLFVNPTREEALGLTNIEANACGTPVVTFRTGGSPECIDETSGSVVDCNDFDALVREIKRICEENSYSAEMCMKKAKDFDKNARFADYINLYEESFR